MYIQIEEALFVFVFGKLFEKALFIEIIFFQDNDVLVKHVESRPCKTNPGQLDILFHLMGKERSLNTSASKIKLTMPDVKLYGLEEDSELKETESKGRL